MRWDKVGWDGGVERGGMRKRRVEEGGKKRDGMGERGERKMGREVEEEEREERRVPACIFACVAFTNEGVSWCARGGCSNAKDKRV